MDTQTRFSFPISILQARAASTARARDQFRIVSRPGNEASVLEGDRTHATMIANIRNFGVQIIVKCFALKDETGSAKIDRSLLFRLLQTDFVDFVG